ncbi:helix-turn-helix domain-containing protein [Marinactinospora thermotolerans]|uniref:helix-turn-helix domain-containing protein n=1 Tax=Marinactinospora thermotolerans TaxID=531310 RepID=UPI003D902BC1
MPEQDISIADRVRDIRQLRGLTQEELAEKAGVSLSTVAKIERGGTARMESYHAIARALGVITLAFATPETPAPAPARHQDGALAEIRAAISPPVGLTGSMLEIGADTPDLEGLRDASRRLAHAYDRTKYDQVARLAPAIVRSAHFHVRELDGRDREEAQRLRSRTLNTAGRYLIQVREHDLALMALRDALSDALAVGDSLLAASAVSSQAWALIRQARFTEVERLCVAAADQVEPKVSKAAPAELSSWGWLLLRASAAAARNNRPEEARDLMRTAMVAAEAIGHEDTEHSFGPVTVKAKDAENAVISGRPERALEISAGMDVEVASHIEWCRHGVDKAKAHVMLGKAQEATDMLAEIRGRAPEWLRHQESAREVTADLIELATRRPSRQQIELASFLGVPA